MKDVITEGEVSHATTATHATTAVCSQLFDDRFDPIESSIRQRVRGFIEAMIEAELDEVLSRPRYRRRPKVAGDDAAAAGVAGHRHGRRTRTLTGTFGKTDITVPRARLAGADGKTTEWKSKALRACQRRTVAADALIASAYLSGTNTRVRRALGALFGGAIGKDTVRRVWRKVKSDWDAWHARSLQDEAIVRIILDAPSQWRSVRTTNAIERLHEEFKRRIKTQTVLPSAETAAMLFWALLASGQIIMRKVDGWQTLATKPLDQPIDLAA